MDVKKKIIAIGANPAWQKVLQFDQLHYNEVNRAGNMWSFASGKGINFARAAKVWGRADAEVLQFAGGDNGKLLLDDLKNEALNVKTFPAGVPTRCCTTLLSIADGAMTEIIEPSAAPDDEAQKDALAYLENFIADFDGIALCGQLPGSMAIDFYVRCAEIAAAHGKLLLIDSWKNINAVLQRAQNAILKINADELRCLTGIESITDAVNALFSSGKLNCIAITDGVKQAYLKTREALYSFNIPHVEKVINPVGSGDTASAVFFSEILCREAPDRAFARALAAASANCMSMKCAEFEIKDADELYKSINITEL